MKKTFLFTRFVLTLSLLGVFSVIMAQNGSISGIVKDEVSTLPSATILIDGTDKGTITDLDGKFFIGNVPAGNQTLLIRYVGYADQKVEVKVESGKTTTVENVTMSTSSEKIEEVQVVASDGARSQAKAYNMQKMSPKMMNVIAADKIGKLPDKNAAEAVQRVVGVTIERDQGEGRYVIIRGAPTWWNSVMLNGERLPTGGGGEGTGRDVPLDILPANFLQMIEVNKTLSPDMEADAIGGSVNYITSTAPQERILDLDLAVGYHNQSHKTLQNANLTFGDRIGKFGFMLSGAWYNRNWGSDNYEVIYDIDATEEARANGSIADNEGYARELQLRDYMGTRRTGGFNWGAEYQISPNSKVYTRGMYSDFQDTETRRQWRYQWYANRLQQNLTHAIYHTRLMGGDVGYEHTFMNGGKLDMKVAYWDNKFNYLSPNQSEVDDTTSGYYCTYFQQSGLIYNNVEENGLYLVTPDNFENIQPGVDESTPVSEGNMLYLKSTSSGTLIREIDKVAKVDYTTPLSNRVDLSVGGKVRLKDRTNFRKYATWTPVDGAEISIEGLTDDFPENGGFLTEVNENYTNLLTAPLNVDEGDNIIFRDDVEKTVQRRLDLNYEGKENFYAFYALANIRFTHKLSALVGGRYEMIDLEYNAMEYKEDIDGNGTYSPKTVTSNSGEFLPNLQFKYAALTNMNLRMSFSRGMARPEFNRLSPNDEVSVTSDGDVVYRGNPDLRPEKTWNFDVLGEYFFKDVGVLSTGVFYKVIEDFPNAVTFMEGTTEVHTWENTGEGYLLGFEFGLQKRLTFLPGAFNGLGIELNYTFADSEVEQERDGEVYKGRLQNQPKHTFNGGLFYEKYGFAFRTALHYKGAFIAEFQGSEPEVLDRWYDSNMHLSLTSSYNITEKLKVYVEMSELLNSPLRYYAGSTNLPEEVEYYSWRGSVGIRMSIF